MGTKDNIPQGENAVLHVKDYYQVAAVMIPENEKQIVANTKEALAEEHS